MRGHSYDPSCKESESHQREVIVATRNDTVDIRYIWVLVVCGSVALVFGATIGAPAPQQDLASFVNPLVGTANSGNTYPGATLTARYGGV